MSAQQMDLSVLVNGAPLLYSKAFWRIAPLLRFSCNVLKPSCMNIGRRKLQTFEPQFLSVLISFIAGAAAVGEYRQIS
jgi:hypothetical protein